jgi:hypothetical protein
LLAAVLFRVQPLRNLFGDFRRPGFGNILAVRLDDLVLPGVKGKIIRLQLFFVADLPM